MHLRALWILSFSAVVAGCATPPPPAPVITVPMLTPPRALTMSNVPAVPTDLPNRIGRYTEFKGASLLDWSADSQQLLVGFLYNNRSQLHQAVGGKPLQLLTKSDEPTRSGRYLPADSNIVVFERDSGGNEANRVYRLDIASGLEVPLTASDQRCDAGAFDKAGSSVLVNCVPLDRSAGGGNAEKSGGVSNEILLIDVKTGNRRSVAQLPGSGWAPIALSPDDRQALLLRYRSASDSEIWTLDMRSGVYAKLLPKRGEPTGFYVAVGYSTDGRSIFLLTDRLGEFNSLYRYDPNRHYFDPLTADIPWDVIHTDLSRDRSRISVVTNEHGRGVLRLFDARNLKPIAVNVATELTVTSAQLSADGRRLAYAAQSARAPSEVHVIDLQPVTNKSKRATSNKNAKAVAETAPTATVWAAADTAGMDTLNFPAGEVIEWSSFDGRRISGLIQRPPKNFPGKRPVLIEVHGGPEAQARAGFNGRYNYIINQMGIAFIEPNVRGSTGFGKSFEKLDNGKLREDAVKDLGALLDWIATQPDLDASRVVIQGGSYGGYMAYAAAVRYSNKLRGVIPMVGISNFVSFLERTESYRRDLRRSEYGDERDAAMRAFLRAISPLTQADKIKTPIFIVHGRNDPRVPVQEAEQMASNVVQNNVPVWLMIAENEGHGFGKKENADYLFYTRILFLERFLLK